ncbi:MAG: SDR family oxidoreductase [Chloroflexi bacterium]|nr:SDR family oxidoreductase [Chloroflexota bacterium]
MRLEDQRIVVVGASSGMGLGVCKTAAAEGAEVIMVSRSEDKLKTAQESVDGQTRILPVDASDVDALRKVFNGLGQFDHLVVTADAGTVTVPFVDVTRQQAEHSFLKFWIAFHSAQAAADHLREDGSITLFAGVAGLRPMRNGAALMSPVNGAVISLGKTLARELAPIRVNVVAPGSVDTGRWDAATVKGVANWAQESLPVPRAGTPADIADSVLFLLTNPYTTGIVLFVDGGLMLS